MLRDDARICLVRSKLVEGAVIGLRIDTPEPGAADIGDTRAALTRA